MACIGGRSLHARCDWLCRLDPPKREHFGDGKFSVRWGGGDFAQYQQARQPQIQQLVQNLEGEGRPRSASRVRRAVAAGCLVAAVSGTGQAGLHALGMSLGAPSGWHFCEAVPA